MIFNKYFTLSEKNKSLKPAIMGAVLALFLILTGTPTAHAQDYNNCNLSTNFVDFNDYPIGADITTIPCWVDLGYFSGTIEPHPEITGEKMLNITGGSWNHRETGFYYFGADITTNDFFDYGNTGVEFNLKYQHDDDPTETRVSFSYGQPRTSAGIWADSAILRLTFDHYNHSADFIEINDQRIGISQINTNIYDHIVDYKLGWKPSGKLFISIDGQEFIFDNEIYNETADNIVNTFYYTLNYGDYISDDGGYLTYFDRPSSWGGENPAPSEYFNTFEAETLPAEPFSGQERELKSRVNDYGNYNWAGTMNHLAQGVQVFNESGELIYSPPMNIINEFNNGQEFTKVFETTAGHNYAYRWRYHFIDYLTGATIASTTTNLESFNPAQSAGDPNIETLDAINITKNSAELRGQINDLGLNTDLSISFEYRKDGATTWNETPEIAILDNLNNYPATTWEVINGLDLNQKYEYRLKANEITGNLKTFQTLPDAIPEPEPDPAPADDWGAYYLANKSDDFSAPTGAIDAVGNTLSNFMTSIRQRIEPFKDRINTTDAFIYGREAGEFIPTARGYIKELRPFFGGLPIAEIILFFLFFEFLLLGVKAVKFIIGIIPFF